MHMRASAVEVEQMRGDIIAGVGVIFSDDLALLEAGMTLYDSFYRWARDAFDESHGWPPAPAKGAAAAGARGR